MAFPVYAGAGAAVSGTGNVTPSLPSGWAQDDIFLLATETADGASATPSGWAFLGTSQQGGGTRTRLTLWWRRATASETDPVTIADPGDHVLAQIFAFRGCDAANAPDLGTFGGNSAASAWSAPAVTTTVANCLIAIVGSVGNDTATPQFSAFANAGLANIVTRSNIAVTDGNGGGLALATAELGSAGSTGDTTASLAASQAFVSVHVVLLPAAGVAGIAAITEAPDIGTAAATLGSHGAALLVESGDTLVSASALALASALAAVEGTDTLLATGAVRIVAGSDLAEQADAVAAQSLVRIAGILGAMEQGDGVSAAGLLPLKAAAAPVEDDDTLQAETFIGRVPLPYRKGGDDGWERAKRERQWQLDLRRIIDDAWRIANGEIDPITREEYPPPTPPDYTAVNDALTARVTAAQRQRAQAMLAAEERTLEDEAIAILLAA